MQKIILKIYIKNKKLPLCEVNVESDEIINKLYEDLNNTSKNVIKFGQIVFAINEFRYLTIEYK